MKLLYCCLNRALEIAKNIVWVFIEQIELFSDMLISRLSVWSNKSPMDNCMFLLFNVVESKLHWRGLLRWLCYIFFYFFFWVCFHFLFLLVLLLSFDWPFFNVVVNAFIYSSKSWSFVCRDKCNFLASFEFEKEWLGGKQVWHNLLCNLNKTVIKKITLFDQM